MANNQAYLFIVFTLVGIMIGVLFDIFRILRKVIKTKDFITYIEDITFWILTGIIIIYSMYKFCDGELRLFMVLGIIIGTLLYVFTFSQYFIKISVFIINLIKKIIIKPIHIFIMLLRNLFLQPILIICVNFRKKYVNIVKKNKKVRGIFKKKEKYNSM